ncbi:MAG: hypothetical protein IJ205_04290 [Bacteroidales bacterium]|nr:hypothetical protein [Bacteroidales bacterium]
MINRFYSLLAAVVLAAFVCGCSDKAAEEKVWGDYVVACGDKDVYIVDASKSTDDSLAVIWHWNVFESYGQIPDDYRHWIRVLDDCKPVNGGKQLLLTSSANGTLLLDIATRKCLFYARTPMSHSADVLPGNRIAVANSTNKKGNSLEIYDIARPDVCVWKDSLYFGHGVVWSEKYQKLYALGFQELRRYSLKDWESASPSLVLEETLPLPGGGGHELSAAGEDAFIVTNHGGAYLFDIHSKTFTPFGPLEGVKNVKSLNYDPASGRVVYTVAETSWWTSHIYMKSPDKTLSFDPKWRLYKVRVLPELTFTPEPDPALRAEGTNLRIFDDNIWQYDSETIPEKWLPLGIDPRDSVRSIGFAKLVADHKPDIVTLQEYSSHMDGHLAPKLRELGFTNACEKDGSWNFTPVFYDSTAVELLKVRYNLYTPPQFSNSGTKSFTSTVFRHRGTGKVFAVLNTHLWWKSEENQPGSTMARASQIRLMMAEAEIIKAEYDCTVFLMGDMNCEEDSIPIQQLINEGYVPCYKAATVFGDDHNGHHVCSASGFSAESHRKGPDRATGALDHFFIHNAPAGTEVLVYRCIMDDYTLPLTDHYPNYVDVKL